ncbi:MAG: hypothetical protein ACPLZ9_01340 [Candidatus Ratteibacteria bacterium]
MKKIITLLVMINLIILYNLNAQTGQTKISEAKEKLEQYLKENSILREKLKEFIETQKKIKEMEREEIEKDPELKNLHIQIMNLRIQMRQNLQDKLKDNEEYQILKKRMDEMNEKIKKEMEERKKKLEEKMKKMKEQKEMKGGEKI